MPELRAGLGRRMQRLLRLDTITGYAAGVQPNGGVGRPAPATIPSATTTSMRPIRKGWDWRPPSSSVWTFDVTDVVVEGNVFCHCSAAMLCFNWDEEANPDHQFQHQFPGQLCLYSAMSNWTDNMARRDGYTGSFTIDGGPNMQDGTVEVQDNVFFTQGSVWCISGPMCPEYLPDCEGNCYAQFSDRVFLSSVSAPCYWVETSRRRG